MTEPPGQDHVADSRFVRGLAFWVVGAQRRAALTVLLMAVMTAVLGFYATRSLGFNVDPNALFSADLRFQKMIREFSRHFPVLTDSLLIVVDGATPEATRDAQEALAVALATRTNVFKRVFLPGEDPFFERRGLLYGDIDELEDFADHMALFQPVLGKLSQDPSLQTLTRVLRQGLESREPNGKDDEVWERILSEDITGLPVNLVESARATWASLRDALLWRQRVPGHCGRFQGQHRWSRAELPPCAG